MPKSDTFLVMGRRLNAKDVTAALRSRNVQMTEEQAQLFIEGTFKELRNLHC